MTATAMAVTPVELVLHRLTANGCNPRRSGEGWSARCPVVDNHKRGDRNPSLSVGENPVGFALLHCHAGCSTPDVARALELNMRDLFPDKPRAAIDGGSRIVATYDYYDLEGTLVFQVVRLWPKSFRQRRLAPDGTWVWNTSGVDKPLYHAPQVAAAIAAGKPVWITEGEKDAEALQWVVDGATTTNAGGAGKWLPAHTDALTGATTVHVVHDADETGLAHARTVVKAIRGHGCRIVVHRPPEPFKDAAEALGAGHAVEDFTVVWDSEHGGELDTDDTDWSPVDLREIARAMRAGEWEPIVPTVLEVDGDKPLFYAGRINQLFGESGGGKTWVGLAAVASVARAGRRALFVDYEDTPAGVTERLVLLDLDDDAIGRVDYRNPTTGLGIGLPHLLEALDEYALVVVDSTGEAMASGAVNPNADDEVALWFRKVRELTTMAGGPAVVVLDHVPKDTEAPGSYAIGSQRKRAAVTGASYRVTTLKEPAKGRDGKLKLVVAKDRLGNRPKGATAAEVDIASEPERVTITLHRSEAQIAAEAGERFRPTVLMERVSRFLELNPGATQRQVREGVSGKATGVVEALRALIEDGFVVTSMGGNRAIEHTVTQSYREGDTPVVPSGSQWFPSGSRNHWQEAVSGSPDDPPSRKGGGSAGTTRQPPTGTIPNGSSGSPLSYDPKEIF